MSGTAPKIQDRAVFFGWVAALVILCALVWTLTRPLQSRYLLRGVNRIFLSMDDPRRLAAPSPRFRSRPGLIGMWFTMLDSPDLFFVFGMMRDGILVPCGARVSARGRVEEIIPLSAHAKQVLGSTPPGITHLYIRRIESSFAEGGGM
jgi:hypothetical protein